jgi:hypothetical protein
MQSGAPLGGISVLWEQKPDSSVWSECCGLGRLPGLITEYFSFHWTAVQLFGGRATIGAGLGR